MVACKIIVSAPVPFPFLWTLDFGFGTWIWDLDLGLGFGTWILDLDLGLGFGTGIRLDLYHTGSHRRTRVLFWGQPHVIRSTISIYSYFWRVSNIL